MNHSGKFSIGERGEGFQFPNLGQRSPGCGTGKDIKDDEVHSISWGDTTSDSQRSVECCQLHMHFIPSHQQQMLLRFNLFNKWWRSMRPQQKASVGISRTFSERAKYRSKTGDSHDRELNVIEKRSARDGHIRSWWTSGIGRETWQGRWIWTSLWEMGRTGVKGTVEGNSTQVNSSRCLGARIRPAAMGQGGVHFGTELPLDCYFHLSLLCLPVTMQLRCNSMPLRATSFPVYPVCFLSGFLALELSCRQRLYVFGNIADAQ